MTTRNENDEGQIVLDTSVVSVLFNPTDYRYAYYSEALEGFQLSISFQTIEERWFGAFYGKWGRNRIQAMDRHLSKFRVIWPSRPIIERCARLRSERRQAGRELSLADAWIAATALTLGCPLASDDGDFDGIPELTLIQRPR